MLRKRVVRFNTEVPAKAEQQAETQFSSYAQALSQIDKSGTNGEYQLGKPFKIYKFNGQEDGNYYFPVLQGLVIQGSNSCRLLVH